MATELLTDAETGLARLTLRISYDADQDFLWALVPGAVIDGQGDEETDELLDGLYLWREGAGGPFKGFGVDGAFAWDVIDQTEGFVWGDQALRFDVPTLALRNASIGEIVLAAQKMVVGSTPDVVLFDQAVNKSSNDEWEEAEQLWRMCLATGEMKAHFGLGYTLVELGRPQEAFGHLAMYTEITPNLAWAWVWRARAAEEMGELAEARSCLEHAIEVDDEDETDAAERLDALAS